MSCSFEERNRSIKQETEDILKQQVKILTQQTIILRRQNTFTRILAIGTIVLALASFVSLFNISPIYDHPFVAMILLFSVGAMQFFVILLLIISGIYLISELINYLSNKK